MTGTGKNIREITRNLYERAGNIYNFPLRRPLIIGAIGTIALIGSSLALEFYNTGKINGENLSMYVDTFNNTFNLTISEGLKNLTGGVEVNHAYKDYTGFPAQTNLETLQTRVINPPYDRLKQIVEGMMGR